MAEAKRGQKPVAERIAALQAAMSKSDQKKAADLAANEPDIVRLATLLLPRKELKPSLGLRAIGTGISSLDGKAKEKALALVEQLKKLTAV